MLPNRADTPVKRHGAARLAGTFRTPVSSVSVRRSSAVLPSLLTFLVIVASGGLLMMIEKGMLNSVEAPGPRPIVKRTDTMDVIGNHSPADEEVDLQVTSQDF